MALLIRFTVQVKSNANNVVVMVLMTFGLYKHVHVHAVGTDVHDNVSEWFCEKIIRYSLFSVLEPQQY
jgi:hypothetical protein